ncbi:MAG: helix-hairpin-helix domain-containing protein [Ignavibacteriales bacterium]|nr:helix-hairpin-helix domain-containing protein [Ignavibacteriales bacterium]
MNFITARSFYCQEDSTYQSDELIENLIEESTIDVEDSPLLDEFEMLKENPIDLNSAELDDLLKIPGIDLQSAKAILDYRKKVGHIFSITELYTIKELDKAILESAIPFLTVETKQTQTKIEKQSSKFYDRLNTFKLNVRSRIIKDIQTRKGFSENKFAGSNYKTYNRFKLQYDKNIQIGFLSEKDAGERSLADFTAYHFDLKDFGILRRLVVGDYNLAFGEGLALSSPYGFSKGGNAVTSVIKSTKNIIPYLSSNENQFFKGAAFNLMYSNINLTTFYSNNKLDASIDSSSMEISSLVIDGYHRTENEIAKKQIVNELFYGCHLNYSVKDLFSTGLLFYHSEFNIPFQPSNPFDIFGNNFNCFSFNYKLHLDNFFFSGEAAWNNSLASINTVQLKLTNELTTVISIRSYPQDYFPLHSFGFGENSGSTINEFGIYTGINFKTKIGNFNFFFDQFKFPGATYNNPLPSKGIEFYLDYEVKPIKKVELNLRYKNEQKEVAENFNTEKKLYPRVIQSLKTEIGYQVSSAIKLKSRFDYTNYFITDAGINEHGYMFYQDIKYKPSKQFSLNLRMIYFQTDSYNSRLYEYENDLNGVLANPVLFGTGIRWYFLAKYQLQKLITISIKYSETTKPNEKTLGSGYSEIQGNLDNRINLQLDFLF